MKTSESNDQKLFIALADLDLCFTFSEVEDCVYLWWQGQSLKTIYMYLKKKYNKRRTYDEVCALIMDLSINDRINPRPRGIHDNTRYMGDEETED